MEDRINQGYRLFVEHNPEKQELVGVYMKATGGATTKIRTGKQELDFFKILPSTKEQIETIRLCLKEYFREKQYTKPDFHLLPSLFKLMIFNIKPKKRKYSKTITDKKDSFFE